MNDINSNNDVAKAAMSVSKKISLYLPQKLEILISISFIKSELTGFNISFEVGGDMDNLRMYGLSRRYHSVRLHSSIIGWECDYDGITNNISELHPNLREALIEFACKLRHSINNTDLLKVLANHKIKNFTIKINAKSISINHIVDGYGCHVSTNKDRESVVRVISSDICNEEVERDVWGINGASSTIINTYNRLFLMLEPLMRKYGNQKTTA